MTVTRVETTKTDKLRLALTQGRDIDALRIAKGFRALGTHKVAIQRGWDAYQNPGFHRALGRDPEKLLSAAIAALKSLYPACEW